ncbi:MAG: hypothetical protein JNK77_19920 [Saprospiraceae bacterium]|nr:hypothetical protein [Saprospiraceae bacterium]
MKKFFLPAFGLIALCGAQLYAQDDSRPKGVRLGISEPELIDQFLFAVPGVGSNVRDLLEQKSLKPYLMPVRDVGAHDNELAYISASCLEYYINLNSNYKDNLSPDYISLNLNASGKQDTPEEILRFLAQTGTVSAAIMPYGAKTITGAVFNTPKRKISNYLYLFRELTKDHQRTYETKKALMRGHPVLVTMQVDEGFRAQRNTKTWAPSGPVQRVFPFLVVGFDENQEAFELLSCWGPNWGLGGYLWVKYTDFGKFASDGFVMVP